MLVLTRKKGETIIIGDSIKVSIVDVQGDSVRIGIMAPKEVSIYRQELYEEIQAENRKATDLSVLKTELAKMLKSQEEE